MIDFKKTRRKNGDGNWGKRTINGIEYLYFRKSYEHLNTPKTFYGKTQSEVKKKIKDFESNKNNYLNKKEIPKETFYDYSIHWLYNVKKSQIKRKTFDGYEDVLKSYVQPFLLGKTQMTSINKEVFEFHIKEMSKKYARSTIKKAYAIIKQCLEYAVEEKHVAENYAQKVKLPSEDNVANKKKEIKFLTENEMYSLYKEAIRTKEVDKIKVKIYGINALMCAFIAYTGLRIGECIALSWEDINFENDYMRVKNNMSLVRKEIQNEDANIYEWIEGTTKTSSGYRYVPLVEISKEILMSIYKDGFDPKQKIFTNKDNKTPNLRNITRTLYALQDKLSMQRSGLHSLRHSFGSLLILHGNDIKVVSEILGHSDVNFTYNVYIHILDEQKAKATKLITGVDKLESISNKELNVNNNEIDNCNINQFNETNTLMDLKNNGIEIAEIDSGMLGYIKDMKIVKVAFTDIININDNAFYGKDIYNAYYNIEEIDIKNQQITDIQKSLDNSQKLLNQE